MSRTVKEEGLTTRNARLKLVVRAKPYWRKLGTDIHLGYRKGTRGGSWLVRWYVVGKYLQKAVGSADDVVMVEGRRDLVEDDEKDYLSFEHASQKAVKIVAEGIARAKAEAQGPALKVRMAVERYITMRNARAQAAGSNRSDAGSGLALHVLKHPIADKYIAALVEGDLKGWRDGMPADLAGTTVARVTTDFRAALNAGYASDHRRLPTELPMIIRRGLKADAAPETVSRKQVFPDADIRRLIAAGWQIDHNLDGEGDIGRLNLVLAASGARFSQVIRMRVADVIPDDLRLMIPTSRKGRPGSKNKQSASIPVTVGEDVIGALLPIINGRPGSAPLLERWWQKQVRPGVWIRESRGPWRSTGDFTRPWRAIVSKAGLASDTVAYCYRHSSIVRGLRAGLPAKFVAARHDTSLQMLEKHYASYIVDALDDMARKAVVPLTTVPASITPITRKQAS
jgi:integrase